MSQTLTGVPLATLDPTALRAPLQPIATVRPRPPGTIGCALDVVLERTRRGDEELIQHRFGLGAARWQLLAALDGKCALGHLTQSGANPDAGRLVSDAARLVAFGLCRAVRGELPRSLMVAAMNLTVRLPRALMPAAAPARPQPTALDTLEPDSATRPLHLAAAIVAALLLAWLVFEIARA